MNLLIINNMLKKYYQINKMKVNFHVGDTVKLYINILEGKQKRIQIFEGIIIKRKNGININATFTIRKISNGIGVERIFPLYTPLINKIEIIKFGKVKKAKLYYLRKFNNKLLKIKEKIKKKNK